MLEDLFPILWLIFIAAVGFGSYAYAKRQDT